MRDEGRRKNLYILCAWVYDVYYYIMWLGVFFCWRGALFYDDGMMRAGVLGYTFGFGFLSRHYWGALWN